MPLRIPTVAINERELDPQWRKKRKKEKRKSERAVRQWTRRNCIRSAREPRIIYLLDLNNKSEDGSSPPLPFFIFLKLLLEFLSLAFSFRRIFFSFRFRKFRYREKESARMSCFEDDSIAGSLRAVGEGKKGRIHTRRTIPLREKTIRGTTPNLFLPKSNYSYAFGATPSVSI